MSFNKIGTPQPLNVLQSCSCGKIATTIVNGQAYCNDCLSSNETNDNIGVDNHE